MDLFEKTIKKAKEIGNSVASSTVASVTKEQTELAGLKIQKNSLEKKIEHVYGIIGKKYVEYVCECDNETAFDVQEEMDAIKPDLDKIKEIECSIAELDAQIKNNVLEREKARVQQRFDSEKEKLDRALSLDIINEEEYADKLMSAKKRLDYFDEIKRIDKQWEMGIITMEEHDEKIAQILG